MRALQAQPDAGEPCALGARRRGRDPPSSAARVVRQSPLAQSPTGPTRGPRHRADRGPMGADGPGCRRRPKPDQRRQGPAPVSPSDAHARGRRGPGAGPGRARLRLGARVRGRRVRPRSRGGGRGLGTRRARGRLPGAARAGEPVRGQDLRRLSVRRRERALVRTAKARVARPRPADDLGRAANGRPRARRGRPARSDGDARRRAWPERRPRTA